jgi:cystathionine beta-lyase
VDVPDERAAIVEALRRRHVLSVKWEQAPEPLIPAWVADMDLVPCEEVRRELVDVVLRGDLGYTSGSLEDRYLRAFESWSKARWGHLAGPRLLTADVLSGLALVLSTLTPAGSTVLVPTPAYPPFLQLPPALGRRVATLELREDRGFRLDPDELEARAREEAAQALILCNPHNPTGTVATRDELLAVAEVARRLGLFVVADEIHQDLLRAGEHHIPFLSLDHPIVEHAVVLTAATKTFNLAGLKAAHVEASVASLLEPLAAIERHLRPSPSPLGLLAGALAWEQGEAWLAATRARLDENIELAVRAINGIERLHTHRPQGTYLLWVHVDGVGAESAAELARRAGVVVSGGEAFFEQGGRSWFRLNVATEPEVLSVILERLGSLG